MSRRQKIAVVAVLVLMAVLYAGAVAGGARTGQGDAGDHPGGLVGWLGRAVGQPPAAARSDLAAPCLRDRTLTVAGHCTLRVASSDRGTRRVRLHATDPVTVESRAPKGEQTVTADVKPGDDVSVTVDGDGTDIAITCAGGDTCTLSLA